MWWNKIESDYIWVRGVILKLFSSASLKKIQNLLCRKFIKTRPLIQSNLVPFRLRLLRSATWHSQLMIYWDNCNLQSVSDRWIQNIIGNIKQMLNIKKNISVMICQPIVNYTKAEYDFEIVLIEGVYVTYRKLESQRFRSIFNTLNSKIINSDNECSKCCLNSI